MTGRWAGLVVRIKPVPCFVSGEIFAIRRILHLSFKHELLNGYKHYRTYGVANVAMLSHVTDEILATLTSSNNMRLLVVLFVDESIDSLGLRNARHWILVFSNVKFSHIFNILL